MSLLRRLGYCVGIIVPLVALGFVLWTDHVRIERVETLSRLAGGDALTPDAASSTGFAGGVRRIVLPERSGHDYEWMAQTQQMLAAEAWRVRHTTYDNAPAGREVWTASPYRWWLAFLARVEHATSGRALGTLVEEMSIRANPLLRGLLFVAVAAAMAWRLGILAGGVAALGVASLFPLTSIYSGGRVDDHGLMLAAGLASFLLLVAGLLPPRGSSAPARNPRRWFTAAGLLAGLSLWFDPADAWPLLVATFAGGGAVAWAKRARRADEPELDDGWRWWGLGAAAVVLVAYWLEYYPDRWGTLRLAAVHPLWGVSCLGAAEWLHRWSGAAKDVRANRGKAITLAGVAAVALLAVPTTAIWADGGALMKPEFAEQLSPLRGGVGAGNIFELIASEGIAGVLIAALLPLGFVAMVTVDVGQRASRGQAPAALIWATAAAWVLAVAAGWQVRLWAAFDLAAIAVAVAWVATTPASAATRRWLAATGALLGLASVVGGLAAMVPDRRSASDEVDARDIEALVGRDLAHWLAKRTGAAGAVVLAPPLLTTSFYFHGELQGLGTPYRENRDGFAAAVRICSATTPDEARALAERRGVTHIVLPSWDAFMDEYARLGSDDESHTLVALLHRWLPPRWLRPVAYQLPQIPGFEHQSVAVFEVTELQSDATALCRLAAYFAETGQLDLAAAAGRALASSFPDEMDALVARAQVAMACGERPEFDGLMKLIDQQVVDGADGTLPWDRRVELAVLLAEGRRFDAARAQVRRSLAEVDEAKVRSLSMVTLYRWQLLARVLGEGIPDSRIRELARQLLPPDMREGL